MVAVLRMRAPLFWGLCLGPDFCKLPYRCTYSILLGSASNKYGLVGFKRPYMDCFPLQRASFQVPSYFCGAQVYRKKDGLLESLARLMAQILE